MVLDVVHLSLELDVHVTLVTSSLPLEAPDALLNVAFNIPELIHRFFLSALDLPCDFVVNFLVFDSHLVFKFSDLHLDDLIGSFDLEVGNLGAQWLDLLSNLLDELPALL